MAVLAFYNDAQCNSLATNIKRECKTHDLTSFRRVETNRLPYVQRLNDAIPSDRRATLISVDSVAYSLLMIPASPLVGLVGDLTGQAGAGLCALCALVVVSGLAAAGKTRYNGRGA